MKFIVWLFLNLNDVGSQHDNLRDLFCLLVNLKSMNCEFFILFCEDVLNLVISYGHFSKEKKG